MKQSQSYLRIKPHFTIIPHSLDQVELRRGIWNSSSFTLNDESAKGKLYLILKDLNGKNSVSDISKKHTISRADVESVLDQLYTLDAVESSSTNLLDYYIEQACPSVMKRLYPENCSPSKNILFLEDNVITRTINHLIKAYFPYYKTRFLNEDDYQYKRLMGSNDQWLYDALKLENEIQQFSDWKDCFIVYAQPVLNPIICSRLNMITHELEIPWIHGAIDGPLILIGPLFSAPEGPCYACFETRVSMNLREHASYVKYKQALIENKIMHQITDSLHSPLVHLLASHLSLEIINYLSTGTGFTRNKVFSIYLPTMEMVFNEVLKMSSCSVCGAVEHRDNNQLYFDYQSLFM